MSIDPKLSPKITLSAELEKKPNTKSSHKHARSNRIVARGASNLGKRKEQWFACTSQRSLSPKPFRLQAVR